MCERNLVNTDMNIVWGGVVMVNHETIINRKITSVIDVPRENLC